MDNHYHEEHKIEPWKRASVVERETLSATEVPTHECDIGIVGTLRR
jgi:hypothetical protein